tara:strand:+ start:3075 stop:3476 length:402 start_codon:yes stop_codon:yes gene_type:complete
MNNFRNNNRRVRFKSGTDRNFRKRNGNGHKNNGDFSSNHEFRRKNPGKNNQNASKLVLKYQDLAREALSNGDKILSENYLQHADHFSRIIAAQETAKDNYNQEKNLHQKNVEDKKSSTDSENKDNESRTISSD